LEPGLASKAIDRFVPRRLNQPGAWVLWNAALPLLNRRGESFLCGFFGDLEVSYQAEVSAVKLVDCPLDIHPALHSLGERLVGASRGTSARLRR
jgi:hypothetical protein